MPNPRGTPRLRSPLLQASFAACVTLTLPACDVLGLESSEPTPAHASGPTAAPTPEAPPISSTSASAPPTTATPPTPTTPALPSSEALLAEAKAAGDDRGRIEAVIAKLDVRLAAKPSADDQFLRAQLLDRLQRREDALAAAVATLALESAHTGAHALAGLLAADLGREELALEHWTAAARATPPDPGSAYNAGQYLQNHGRNEDALAMWKIAAAANPDDFDAVKKIVQAYNALGRYEEAELAKQDAKRIFAASTRPEVKRQNELVIEQLVVEGKSVMITETLVPEGDLYSHWTAIVYGPDGKTRELTVQLESSAYGRETGVPFVIGINHGERHTTLGVTYPELPAYAQWRKFAVVKLASVISGR